MDSCVTVAIVIVVAIALLGTVFLVLLAMPKSRLRSFFLEIGGWGTAGASTLLVVSPVDLLPFMPFEDPIYILTAIAGSITGYLAHRERIALESRNEKMIEKRSDT